MERIGQQYRISSSDLRERFFFFFFFFYGLAMRERAERDRENEGKPQLGRRLNPQETQRGEEKEKVNIKINKKIIIFFFLFGLLLDD